MSSTLCGIRDAAGRRENHACATPASIKRDCPGFPSPDGGIAPLHADTAATRTLKRHGDSIQEPSSRPVRRLRKNLPPTRTAAWPDDVPYRMLHDELYVEDQAAMSEQHGTGNTCPAHAINQAFQGRAVDRMIEGDDLEGIREHIQRIYGIRMEGRSATLPANSDDESRNRFDTDLQAIADRLDAGGTVIVERGDQHYTGGVTQHFVTLVRLARDGRVYLLDSMRPGDEQSFDSALEAVREVVNPLEGGAQHLDVLVLSENTVLLPARTNPCGHYVLNQGFVPNGG